MGGSTKPSTSSQSNSSTLNPNAAAMPALGYMGANMNSIMQTPAGYFPGQGYVGPSDLTQQSVDQMANAGQGMNQSGNMIKGAAMAGYGALPGMMGANNTAMGNYNFLSGAADVANNPYVQGQLGANQRAIEQSLGRSMAGINSGAQSVNAMGSSRQGLMQGQAVGDAMGNLANANASTMLNAYGQGLGAQQNALGQTGAMMGNLQAPTNWGAQLGQMYGQGAQNQSQGAGMLGLGGQTVEGYQQSALNDAIQRYQFAQQEPWQRIQNINQFTNSMQPYGVQAGTGQGTQAGGGPSTSSQVMSGIGTGATIVGAAMMMSDRRLKTNVRHIGKTNAGHNLYAWDYVWGQPGVGVMADEVPEDWVATHESGFKMVDYSKVR